MSLNKMKTPKEDLTSDELMRWALTIPIYSLEGRSFVSIKGKNYLLYDIEKALIKGKGVKAIA
jgi:hypothetical protein